MSLKAAGVESVRTVPFNPGQKNGLTFKEHDMKFLSLRPDLEYWHTVLKEDKPWDKKTTDDKGNEVEHTKEVKVAMQEANRQAVASYILSLSGEALVYADEKKTAYEIQENLKTRYLGTNRMHLAKLQY